MRNPKVKEEQISFISLDKRHLVQYLDWNLKHAEPLKY